MRKSYIAILVLLLLGTTFSSNAQQDPQYTQYMYNTIAINPAYAGSRDVLSIVGLHRSQWVGIDGAPRTQTLSLHSPLGFTRSGLGGTIIHDKIGPVTESQFNIDYSYTIPTSNTGKLSFGIKATANLMSVNYDELKRFDLDDSEYDQLVNNRFSPNVGAGLFYYTDTFYAGLSVPNFLETKHFDSDVVTLTDSSSSSFIAKERLHYYFTIGKTFDLSDVVLFKPALLTKATVGAPLQVDVSANFLFHEKLTLGLAYRWDAALSALVGFQVSDALMLGFAYDRETTELEQYNDGSFELIVRYELFKKYKGITTPRFF